MIQNSGIQIRNLNYFYGTHQALNQLMLELPHGRIGALLGPNGSGKTTLMRILSTLFPCPSETVFIQDFDIAAKPAAVREKIGVVFQSTSLDLKLSVMENLKHHGYLYGLSGKSLKQRAFEVLQRLNLSDRKDSLVEHLSGGLQRRVEIAKGLLHRPQFLLLDEPSTGLDPAVRADLWRYLFQVRKEENVTILVSTHLMDEADDCDFVFIMNEGKVVANDSPVKLCSQLGGDVISLKASDPQELAGMIRSQFNLDLQMVDGELQFEHPEGHRFVTRLVEKFPGQIESITCRKPTLEDVFMHITGHRFWKSEK